MISVLALLALGLTVRVGTRAVGDPDIWWHLKTGQYVLNGGQLQRSGSMGSVRDASVCADPMAARAS